MIIPKFDILKYIVYDYLVLEDLAVFDASITSLSLRASLGLQQYSKEYLIEWSQSDNPYPFDLNPSTEVRISEAMLRWCWKRQVLLTNIHLTMDMMSPQDIMDTPVYHTSIYQSVKRLICDIPSCFDNVITDLFPHLSCLESLEWSQMSSDGFNRLIIHLENNPTISRSLKSLTAICYQFGYEMDESLTTFILATPNMESFNLYGDSFSQSIISLIAHSWPKLKELCVVIDVNSNENDYEGFRESKISLRSLVLSLLDDRKSIILSCSRCILSNSSTSLVSLKIEGSCVDEEGLCEILRSLINLGVLLVDELSYSNRLMVTLSESCHDMRELTLWGDSTIDDEGIRALTTGCPRIERLNLPESELSVNSMEIIANSYRNTLKNICISLLNIHCECKDVLKRVFGEDIGKLRFQLPSTIS